jgi:hypothetical protein
MSGSCAARRRRRRAYGVAREETADVPAPRLLVEIGLAVQEK